MTEKFGGSPCTCGPSTPRRSTTALDAAKQGGFDAVELRRTDFKRCFDAGMSNGEVLDLIRASGIPVGVLGVEYGWLFATGEESERLFKVFRESCENAVALDCKMLMSAPGQINGPIPQAIEYLQARRRHRRRIRSQARHRVQFAARRAQQPAGLCELIEGAGKAELRLSDRRLSLRSAAGYGGASFKDLPSGENLLLPVQRRVAQPGRPACGGRPTGCRPARAW